MEDKTKKLVILPLDDNSKEISQILSNDTARKILESLAENPMTLTEICNNLCIPLSTIQYDIKKLEEAGLIKVVGVKKSEKEKDMKIYAPEEKLIVIVPKKVARKDVISALKSLLPILVFGIFMVSAVFLILNSMQENKEFTGIGEIKQKSTGDKNDYTVNKAANTAENTAENTAKNKFPGKTKEESYLSNAASIKKFYSQEELNAFIGYFSGSSDYYSIVEGRTGLAGGPGGAFGVRSPGGAPGMPYDVFSSSVIASGEGSAAGTKGSPETPETVDYALTETGEYSNDFSKTNIRVQGVDEADIVKNDGRYIYVVSGRKVAIIDAYPPQKAEILSEIEFDESPAEIYINKDNLVIFMQRNDYITYNAYIAYNSYNSYNVYNPQGYYGGSRIKTSIFVYNISDRENPEISREIKADGAYFDSQMIGDYVYAVVNDPVYYQPCLISSRKAGVNSGCLNEDIKAPKVSVGGVSVDRGFPDIYYYGIPDYSYRFTTILSINTQNDEEKPEKKIFVLGETQNIYVSPENIYITGTKQSDWNDLQEKVYDEIVMPNLPQKIRDEIKEIENSNKSFYVKRFDRMLAVEEYFSGLNDSEARKFSDEISGKVFIRKQELEKESENSTEQTLINKIGIKDGKINPEAEGTVPGTVLNQFSMDEYEENFRIATTTQKYGEKQANNLYVLDSDLKIMGKIEDISAGESIYSVRFTGKKAYMVTFKRIDPLFVIDLSDPKKPELAGKLKIPGYSDYLHPYDDSHLIGIGKEVDESVDADKVHSNDAVYYTAVKGVKISVFDVTDINHPVEMYKEVIGDRGTESEALNDHKALLFDKEKHLLVLPILLAEISPEQKKSAERERMKGEFTFQGAYVYDISLEGGFKFKGRVTHINNSETLMKSGYYFDSSYSVRRSLYIADVLYSVSERSIKMNDLKSSSLNEINKINLPYENYLRYANYYNE